MTPEQLEQYREEFESDHTLAARARNSKNKYISSVIQNRWEGFLKGRAKANKRLTPQEFDEIFFGHEQYGVYNYLRNKYEVGGI